MHVVHWPVASGHIVLFFFSSRRRHTRLQGDWSSDVCSSDLLRAHTEIVRVRVTVHVQPSGDTDADQTRSDKRAQAVRDWLVQWGIAPARLEVDRKSVV